MDINYEAKIGFVIGFMWNVHNNCKKKRKKLHYLAFLSSKDCQSTLSVSMNIIFYVLKNKYDVLRSGKSQFGAIWAFKSVLILQFKMAAGVLTAFPAFYNILAFMIATVLMLVFFPMFCDPTRPLILTKKSKYGLL